jgi:ADP-ribosylglycohydrolase
MSFESFLNDRKHYAAAGDHFISCNGSVMRLFSVSIYYHDNIELAMNIAYKQSKNTHQGDEAEECCRLLTFIIIKCINREQINDILYSLRNDFKTDIYSVKYLAKSQSEVDEYGNINKDRICVEKT